MGGMALGSERVWGQSLGNDLVVVTTGGAQTGLLVGDTTGAYTLLTGTPASNDFGVVGTADVTPTTGASGLGAVYGFTASKPNVGGFYLWPPDSTGKYYPIQVGIKGGGGSRQPKTCNNSNSKPKTFLPQTLRARIFTDWFKKSV